VTPSFAKILLRVPFDGAGADEEPGPPMSLVGEFFAKRAGRYGASCGVMFARWSQLCVLRARPAGCLQFAGGALGEDASAAHDGGTCGWAGAQAGCGCVNSSALAAPATRRKSKSEFGPVLPAKIRVAF